MATPMYVSLAAVFAAATLVLWFSVLRRSDGPFLHCYASIQVVFVYALLVQQYSRDVNVETTLLANLLFFAFFAIVLLIGVTAKKPAAHDVLGAALRVPVRVLVVIGVAWVTFEAWLVATHGAVALAFARRSPDQLVSLELAFWEAVLSSAIDLLLMGALALAVIRHAMGHRLGAVPAALLGFVAIAFVALGESPVGSRRFVLLLGVLWFATAWCVRRGTVARDIRRRGVSLCVISVGVIGLAIYYQSIRHNMEDPTIAADVLSGDPYRVASGVGRFLVPTSESERDRSSFLRSGPLDFFVKVVDVVVNEGRSTKGGATARSLSIAVPRVLHSREKPIGDVDDVLAERLHIMPDQPFLYIDYSTSIAAIGMADFGVAGVVCGALLVGFMFRLYWSALFAVRRWPLVYIVVMGAFLLLTASHEAGLTALLASARDATLVAVLMFVLSAVAGGARRLGLAGTRSGYADEIAGRA